MNNPSETQSSFEKRRRENIARIEFFPDKNKKFPPRLRDIAEALEISAISEESIAQELQKKAIRRVLDVGVGRGTDSPLPHLARLSKDNGEWLFPSESLIGIDNSREPVNFKGLYTFVSADVLTYQPTELFDVIYAKGVLSSGWDPEKSTQWRHDGKIPQVFTAMAKLLSSNQHATIILDSYISDEYILLTEQQIYQQGFEVVESSSESFHSGKTDSQPEKMYTKLVLRRKSS